jgi:hypothetical protein
MNIEFYRCGGKNCHNLIHCFDSDKMFPRCPTCKSNRKWTKMDDRDVYICQACLRYNIRRKGSNPPNVCDYCQCNGKPPEGVPNIFEKGDDGLQAEEERL